MELHNHLQWLPDDGHGKSLAWDEEGKERPNDESH